MESVYSYGNLSPNASAFVAFGVVLAGFGLLLVFGISQWRLHHKRWKKLQEEEQRLLSPGLRNVIGKISPLQAPLPAITTNEEQTDIYWSGRRLTRWREIAKERSVAPFQVTTQNGEEVRVEVSDQSHFRMYTRSQCSDVVYKKRTRSNMFRPGEEVWVRGELISHATGADAPFRESANLWVIQPPRGGALYTMQATPSKVQKKFASFYLVWASLLAAVYLGCIAICAPYFLLFSVGQKVDLHPFAIELSTAGPNEIHSAVSWYSHETALNWYSYETTLDSLHFSSQVVSPYFSEQLENGKLGNLPGVAAPDWIGLCQIGDGPSLTQNEALILLLGLLVISCLVVVSQVLYRRLILIKYHSTSETRTE